MKFISITYTRKAHYSDPFAWLHRVRASIGILEALAKMSTVTGNGTATKNNTIISIDRINYSGEITINDVRHIFPETGTSRISSAWRLNNIVSRFKPDVVLVQGMIFPIEVILLRIQLGREPKIIVQNHAEKASTGKLRYFQRLADRVINAYLFTSKEMGREWIARRIIHIPGKIFQVMEASSHFKPKNNPNNSTFLWVGRLDKNKDPLNVVKAFLHFTITHPTAHLYMIFQTTELLPEIEPLLDNTITLLGEKEHDEIEQWYQAADYIISGSHYEGSGIAVCEAMSCGCIPVLTDILSFRMMTGNGACGILYPPGDTKALIAALETITQKDIRAERQKVLDQFRKELSFEAIANSIQNIAASL